MTLRVRLTAWIALLVAACFVVAWWVTRPMVLEPLESDLERGRAFRVMHAAELFASGMDFNEVEDQLGIDLRLDGGTEEGPPMPPLVPPVEDARGPTSPMPFGEQGPPDDWIQRPWLREIIDGVAVYRRPGPEREVAAWARGYWVVMHEGPPRRPEWWLALGFLAVSVPLVVGASLMAGRSLRPVEAAEAAMARVADGELSHRLDEDTGPVELRRMASTFNRMAGEVERRVRMERQLMAGVSHELRTPLTRMRLELELERRKGGNPTRIARLEREVAEVDALVSELLDLSRMEIGQVPVEPEWVPLRQVVLDVVDEDVTVQGEGDAFVDPRLAGRAVSNLVLNSRRHAPGASVTVRLQDGVVEVSDDGPGVPADELSAVFEPFWRGRGSRSTGHGLGLALVAQIAKLHGGTAHAEDADPGLRVRLTFPSPSVAST